LEARRFGGTRREVAVLGQGTWNLAKADRATAVAALRRGLDLGMNHIDTAELYGEAEAIVSEAIAGRREEVFLVSKVLPKNASRAGTHAACERSLAQLRTDHLDCYLLHWRGRHPLAETFGAFEELRAEGKILSWGVSNFDVSDLEEAWELKSAAGPVCNQVLYHLQERAIEHAVAPWCDAHGLAVVAYSPFGSGRFPGPHSRGGRVLSEIAAAHQATPYQVALRFLVRQPFVFAIPKASRPDHTEDNAGSGDLRLSEAELARIDKTFPLGRPPRQLPTL
jgi:diketogulonate reductase-like aldo/keto reductase